MKNEGLDILSTLDSLINKKFDEVFSKDIMREMSIRHKMNTNFMRLISNSNYSIRISLVNEDWKPFEVIALKQLHGNFDEILEGNLDNIDLYNVFSKAIIIIVEKSSRVEDYRILDYLIIKNDLDFMNQLNIDYQAIKSSIKSNLDHSKFARLTSCYGKYLIFKPKDSKPYKKIFSRHYNRIISDKNYGWYLDKSIIIDKLKRTINSEVSVIKSIEERAKVEMDNNSIMKYQFYKLLSELKTSSKDSVTTIDSNNLSNEYLYITRPIEKDFIKIIQKTVVDDEKKLLFLVGNSGDGKSRLLKLLSNKYPELYQQFAVHNDATESYYINRDSVHTLAEVLEPFSDNLIGTGNEKCIVAINLGVIGKFIDSEYSKKFTVLNNFLRNSNILKENKVKADEVSKSNIEYLSFSEYSNFTISPDGVDSGLIRTFFDKIFNESKENPFYKAYCNLPDSIKNDCPVAYNYRSVCNKSSIDFFVNLLLLIHLEQKIMLTPRIIWNFIYEMIFGLDVEYKYTNSNNYNDPQFFLKNIYFNRILDDASENEIFKEIVKKSYIFENYFENDNLLNQLILFKNNADELVDLLKTQLEISESIILKTIESTIIAKVMDYEKLCQSIVRYNTMKNIDILSHYEFIKLNEYGKLLYEYNFEIGKSKIPTLKDFRNKLRETVKTWNGKHFRDDLIYSDSGNEFLRKAVQIDFDVSHKNIQNISNEYSFHQVLEYGISTVNDYVLLIDFSSFLTINHISEGYQLNAYEKLDNIRLNDYVNKLIFVKENSNKQYINSDHDETFLLEYHNSFDSFEFKRE